jgi:hypothetical protein
VSRLAQWIAPILCAGKDSSRPSRGRMVRDLVASVFWHSGVRGVKVPCCPISRNPEPRKHRRHPKSGLQYYGAISAVYPQETPGTRLGSSSFRPSRFQGARCSIVIFPMCEVPGVSRIRAHSIVGRVQNHQI